MPPPTVDLAAIRAANAARRAARDALAAGIGGPPTLRGLLMRGLFYPEWRALAAAACEDAPEVIARLCTALEASRE